MAVTGVADPGRLLRNDANESDRPLTMTKPLGVALLCKPRTTGCC